MSNIYAAQTPIGELFAIGADETAALATVRSFGVTPLAIEFVAADDVRGKKKAERRMQRRAA